MAHVERLELCGRPCVLDETVRVSHEACPGLSLLSETKHQAYVSQTDFTISFIAFMVGSTCGLERGVYVTKR